MQKYNTPVFSLLLEKESGKPIILFSTKDEQKQHTIAKSLVHVADTILGLDGHLHGFMERMLEDNNLKTKPDIKSEIPNSDSEILP